MGNLNKVMLIGRLTRDPEIKEFSNGGKVANIGFAVNYIGAKIMGIALIEALAWVTGGDCSISMFLGDLKSRRGAPLRAEHFLPALPDRRPFDPALMRMLELGRSNESRNDLNTSPITAYLYRYLGQEGMALALQQANRMFAGDLTPKAFLNSLEPELVRTVAEACANIAVSRADALLALDFSAGH